MATATDDRRVERMMLDMAVTKIQHLSAELADLRAAVTALQGARRGTAAACVPRTVFFDADEVGPFERGFYQREFDGNGRPFRWTGQGEFVEFRFFIDRNVAYQFTISGQLYGGADLGPVRAFIDYSPVPVETAYRGDAATLTGEIPPSPFATRATLTLWSPSRWVPAAGDERTLWFAFYDLTAKPVAEATVAAAPEAAAPEAAEPNPDADAATDPPEAWSAAPDALDANGAVAAAAASSTRARRSRTKAVAGAEAGHAAAPSHRRDAWKH
jgi:hypothetical protein